MKWVTGLALIVMAITFGVFVSSKAEDRRLPLKFTEVKMCAQNAAAWRVVVKDGEDEIQYRITETDVIERLALLIIAEEDFIPNPDGIAMTPHVFVDFISKSGDSAVSVEVTGDAFVLLHSKDQHYEAVLSTEDLYDRLADKNFDFHKEGE